VRSIVFVLIAAPAAVLFLAGCADIQKMHAEHMAHMANLFGMSSHTHAEHATAPVSSVDAATPQTEGEVLQVDNASQKLTIKHGRIEALGMPPMTMDYAVKHPSFLALVKTGDKVKFTVEDVGGTYTIVALQPAP
jgi:Cu(I)/Ag(I) efflux system protein CusF